MSSRRYQRRTVRQVQTIIHISDPRRPNATACGQWDVDYEPAPQVFNPGDLKPDRVVVPCPLCTLAAVCADIDQAIANKRDRRQAA